MICLGNVECGIWAFVLLSACRLGRMSTILAQASKARLGKNTRNSSLVVFEYLAQASVSRLGENS